MKPGRVTISLDLECGWGAIESGQWLRRERSGVYDRMRADVSDLLLRLEERDISCTWAVVGALVVPRTEINLDHLDGLYRPLAENFLKSAAENTVSGSDIVEKIRNCKATQVFASHTFTHLRFDDTTASKSSVELELNLAASSMKAIGIEPGSLVLPQNRINHVNMIKSAGFSKLRLPEQSVTGWQAKLLKTLPPAISRSALGIFRRPQPSVRRVQKDGLLTETGTQLLNWGWKSNSLKRRVFCQRILSALEGAKKGDDIHLWLHPFNLSETVGLKEFLFSLLDRLAVFQDRGFIQVEPF